MNGVLIQDIFQIILGGFGMNNKRQLKKRYLNIEIFYGIASFAVAIISSQVINYFIDANTAGRLYQFLMWLIPINSFIAGFWFFAKVIGTRFFVIKRILQFCLVSMEISSLLNLLVYLITGQTFSEFMFTTIS